MSATHYHQTDSEAYRKREEVLQAGYQRHYKLEQQRAATQARINELQSELSNICDEMDSNRQHTLFWRITLLRILQDARREKCDRNAHHSRLFGKCENCWMQCDDADSVNFETAGCDAALCAARAMQSKNEICLPGVLES